MGKWKINVFDFLGKKIDDADITAITQELSSEIALKELALYIGISYIANSISQCEFKTYENNVEVKDSLYYKLNVSPNPNQNSTQLINKFVSKMYYDAEGSVLIQHRNGLYCADSFSIDDTNPLNENTYHNVAFNSQQAKPKYKAREVFHFKMDDKRAKTYIDALYQQYGQIVAAALASYKKTNGKKYKLILEQYAAGDKNFKAVYEEVLKAQLESFIKSDGAAVLPEYKGVKLEEFDSSNRKDTSDIVAMRKEVFETTAQALKLPLSMMYGNITNMDEIVQVYLTFCIDPLADMIGEEITRKYYSFEEWKKGCYVKVDTSCINHVDILKVADAVAKVIGSGATNIDEVRNRLDMPALNTEFSRSHFITKNYELAENMLKRDIDLMEGGEK